MAERLWAALERVGDSVESVKFEEITDVEAAERVGFHGSPTVLVDGSDPFALPETPVSFACRVYLTPVGLQGSPTVEQLVEALR